MKTGKLDSGLTLTCVAAGLVGVFAVQTVPAAAEADAAARALWKTYMSANTASEAGCFHAEYPSYFWEKMSCKVAAPRVRPVLRLRTAEPQVTGNGNDYVAQSSGLTSAAVGTFPTVTGVTSEKSVGVAAFGGGGILGANEYSIQLNTNFTGSTPVCAGHSGCTNWQQFIYATDYAQNGEGAVFIQYWLIGWGSSSCPSGWDSDGGGDCFRNSNITTAPDESPKNLAKYTLSGSAVAGGNDTVVFNDGTHAYQVTEPDSINDIATVWRQSEFNIVGDAGGSRANFNRGSSITVKLALTDGSTAAPACLANSGSTGETNNLNLGTCTASGGSSPSISFKESN